VSEEAEVLKSLESADASDDDEDEADKESELDDACRRLCFLGGI
jgi:hypothetical protein